MCGRCVQLDAKIELYRKIGRGLDDEAALHAVEGLIESCREIQQALHRGSYQQL